MALVELKVPSVGESITEVTLARWLKPEGAMVALDEIICEFDSDKATLEFPAEVAGKLIHVAHEGEDLPIGAIVAKIETSLIEQEAKVADAKVNIDAVVTPPIQSIDVASPAASKMIRENESIRSQVKGTGKGGRITKQDVLSTLSEQEVKTSSDALTPAQSIQVPAKNIRNERRVKLSRMRKTIARRLVEAKQQTAMLTTFNEVDMSALMGLRKNYNESYEKKYGIKIGYMSVFAKACSQVLMEMPEVNARLEEDDLVYHDYTDISIAISTPSGLVVPPIRNVESLSLHEFEKILKVLSEKARSNALSIDEMTGGTFTITNGGIFGSLMSTPILNQPQSAILGMHAIKDRPIAINGAIVIRPMMYLALSYDHRVIDGSSSVQFLVRVKELVEDPVKLFLNL